MMEQTHALKLGVEEYLGWLARGFLRLVALAAALGSPILMGIWVGWQSFAVRVWIVQGFWPWYNHPDPNSLAPDFLPGTRWIDWALALLVVLGTGVVIWYRLGRAETGKEDDLEHLAWRAGRMLVVLPVVWCLSIAWIRLDFLHTLTWIMD